MWQSQEFEALLASSAFTWKDCRHRLPTCSNAAAVRCISQPWVSAIEHVQVESRQQFLSDLSDPGMFVPEVFRVFVAERVTATVHASTTGPAVATGSRFHHDDHLARERCHPAVTGSCHWYCQWVALQRVATKNRWKSGSLATSFSLRALPS